MNIIIYGVEITQPGPPDVRMHICKDQTSLVEMALTLNPNYIIAHEGHAEWVLDVLRPNLQTPVIVVCEIETPQVTRDWTAKGAYTAWSRLKWEQLLHQLSDQPEEESEEIHKAGPTFERNARRTEIIAVGGVASGIGSTHLSVLIAAYLSRFFRTKVAILEYGSKPCFHQLDTLRNGQQQAFSRLRFEINNLTFLKAAHYSEYATEDFDYVVVDMGELEHTEDVSYFFKSSLPVLVASSRDWRVHELFNFCSKNSSFKQDRMCVAFPMGEEESLDFIRSVIKKRPLYSVPQHSDPFAKQSDTDESLESILYPLLPKKPRNGISRFFGGK